jgi:hypothetical protein
MAFSLELESGVDGERQGRASSSSMMGSSRAAAFSGGEADPPVLAFLRRHRLESAFVRIDQEGESCWFLASASTGSIPQPIQTSSDPSNPSQPQPRPKPGSTAAAPRPVSRMAKSMGVIADGRPWIVVTRGDHRIDMHKAGNDPPFLCPTALLRGPHAERAARALPPPPPPPAPCAPRDHGAGAAAAGGRRLSARAAAALQRAAVASLARFRRCRQKAARPTGGQSAYASGPACCCFGRHALHSCAWLMYQIMKPIP